MMLPAPNDYHDVPEAPQEPPWARLWAAAGRLKRRIVFSIGKRLPPREARTEDRNGHVIYTCPRCGDFVYCAEQCVSCGQRFLPGAKTIGGMLDERFTDP